MAKSTGDDSNWVAYCEVKAGLPIAAISAANEFWESIGVMPIQSANMGFEAVPMFGAKLKPVV